VYLTGEDVTRAAKYLAADEEEFQATYCDTDSAGDLRLTTPPDRACHFLQEGGCSIHEAKPLQCGLFRFGRSMWDTSAPGSA
jgi:Fe-S-cluster containining protein